MGEVGSLDTILEDEMRMDLIDRKNVRSFEGRDILRIDDFNRDEITYLLEVARIMGSEFLKSRKDLRNFRFRDLLEGLNVGTIFTEDSTRTHDSYVQAASNLGAKIDIQRRNALGTSQSKGESPTHDFATEACYGLHAVIMRTKIEGLPQALSDYLTRLSKAHPNALDKPVIHDGGDGSHEHPTQALLDMGVLYNMFDVGFDGKEVNSERKMMREDVLSGITMIAVGDTFKGRTYKSLARGLSKFEDNEIVIVSPEAVRSPPEDIEELKSRGLKVTVMNSVDEAIAYASKKKKSFIYGLRTQEERLEAKVFEKVKGAVHIATHHLEDYDGPGILYLLHPLPMNQKYPEIAPEIDFRKEAKYIDEMKMGMFMRMGLLATTLGRLHTKADNRPYIDTRVKEGEKKFVELPVPELYDDNDEMMRTIAKLLKDGRGQDAIRRHIESVRSEDYMQHVVEDPNYPFKLALGLFSDVTDQGRLIELARHLSFRFMPGESGFVMDHIEDGKTGIIKFFLGLSAIKEGIEIGCDGKPVVISAVDGLDSGKYGQKGVIKVRGYMPDPEAFQYCYFLSRKTDPTVTYIENGKPIRKIKFTRPEVLVDFAECSNPDCVTRHVTRKHAPVILYRTKGDMYECRYCNTKADSDRFKLFVAGSHLQA